MASSTRKSTGGAAATPRKARGSRAAHEATDSGKENTEPDAAPKKRGRPKGKTTVAVRILNHASPGKRGRPAGSKNATKSDASAGPVSTRSGRTSRKPVTLPTVTATAPKRGRPATKGRRGRPAKTKVPEDPNDADVESGSEPKRRGRPKGGTAKPKSIKSKAKVPIQSKSLLTASGKKRGRPAKGVQAAPPIGKKRGRPAGSTNKPKPLESVTIPSVPASSPKKRGRPPRETANATADDEDSAAPPAKRPKPDTSAPRKPGETLYWLMKAEPESRIETAPSGKQVDVKFSIDDLASRTQPELWDGIRNPQARNNLRAMAPGDLAFLSESNTKIPGLVGIMEIVGEAVPDEAQFSEDSPYFDPKATRDSPRWDAVPVKLLRRFENKFPAPGSKASAEHKARFGHLQMFASGRLSVRRVAREEWEEVMREVDALEGRAGEATEGQALEGKAAEADETMPDAPPPAEDETLPDAPDQEVQDNGEDKTDGMVEGAIGLLGRIGDGISGVFGSPAKASA